MGILLARRYQKCHKILEYRNTEIEYGESDFFIIYFYRPWLQ
jgi:hypothetical protein